MEVLVQLIEIQDLGAHYLPVPLPSQRSRVGAFSLSLCLWDHIQRWSGATSSSVLWGGSIPCQGLNLILLKAKYGPLCLSPVSGQWGTAWSLHCPWAWRHCSCSQCFSERTTCTWTLAFLPSIVAHSYSLTQQTLGSQHRTQKLQWVLLSV